MGCKHGQHGCLFLAACMAMFFLQGCKSRRLEIHESSGAAASAATAGTFDRPLDGGTYCVQVFPQGPPLGTPLHFSNKVTSSGGSSKDFEADLAGDTLDVTVHERRPATDLDRESSGVPGAAPVLIRDGFVEETRTNHYSRADKSGWIVGSNSIVLGATPWNLFVAKPEARPVSRENVNGYETIKYAVDTTRQSSTDKWAFDAAWRVRDYNITGSAWATKDTRCILKYSIEVKKNDLDGRVERTNYEGEVVKK